MQAPPVLDVDIRRRRGRFLVGADEDVDRRPASSPGFAAASLRRSTSSSTSPAGSVATPPPKKEPAASSTPRAARSWKCSEVEA